MLHENLIRSEEVEGPSNRRFGLTICVACGTIAVVRALFLGDRPEWWLGAALLVGGLAIFWPASLTPLNWLWLKLGLLLHKVANPIVMTVLFISTITPVGILMRLNGKDTLRLLPRPHEASYWIVRDPPGQATETMKNQF